MTQTEEKKDFCHWCGSEVGNQVWKDGKRAYCSTECHSAGMLPVFVLIIGVFTPLIALELIFPGSLTSFVLNYYSGIPIFAYGLFVAIIVVYFIGILFGYQGWKARKEIIRHRDT